MIRASIFLLLLLSPTLARSDTLAIVDLRFAAVPPTVREQIRARIQQTLTQEGYELPGESVVQERLKRAAIAPGCTVGPCLVEVGRALEVERAIVGGVSGQGTSYDITLTLLETNGGSVLAQVSHRCDVCNFKEVERAVVVATQRLHKEALGFLSTRAFLVVSSDPKGANILLDGVLVGKTPFRHILNPGPHMLEVAAMGHRSVTQQLHLKVGRTHTASVTLIPRVPGSLVDRKRRRRSRGTPAWIKWVLLGTGVAVGGVGGGLFALDGHETSDPRYVHDTRTAGVTMISLGAAAALTAGLMAVLDLRGRRSRPTTSAARDHAP